MEEVIEGIKASFRQTGLILSRGDHGHWSALCSIEVRVSENLQASHSSRGGSNIRGGGFGCREYNGRVEARGCSHGGGRYGVCRDGRMTE
jgi:hypothetical protein